MKVNFNIIMLFPPFENWKKFTHLKINEIRISYHFTVAVIEGVTSESVNGVVGVWAYDFGDTHRWEETIAEKPKNRCVNFKEHWRGNMWNNRRDNIETKKKQKKKWLFLVTPLKHLVTPKISMKIAVFTNLIFSTPNFNLHLSHKFALCLFFSFYQHRSSHTCSRKHRLWFVLFSTIALLSLDLLPFVIFINVFFSSVLVFYHHFYFPHSFQFISR